GSPEPALRLAQVQVQGGDLRGAISRIRAVLRTAPGHLRARELLGDVYLALGRNDEALQLARGLQRSHPALAAGWRLEGDVWLAVRNAAQAAAAFQRAEALQSSGLVRIRLHRASTL